MRGLMVISLICKELRTPSGQPSPLPGVYLRTLTACGHAMLGAAICAPWGPLGLAVGIPVAILYWLIKERADLRRGGALWDGLEDTIMVALGAWAGAWWWPIMVLGCMGYIMVSAAWRLK